MRFQTSRFKLNTVKLLGLVCLLFLMSGMTLAQSDPALSISDQTVPEGDANFFGWSFEIKLSAPSTQPISVTVSTQPGTALNNVDFGAGSQVLNFQPGQTSQTLDVLITGDTVVEGTE